MDTYLAIVSKRDTRRYADTPIPEDVVERILDAGRVTGSASNRQPWRFLIVEDAERRERLADAVYEPTNIRGAQLVVAILGKRPLDLGRCAQNMMLAAWNDGVASCPNGIADADAANEALGLEEPPVNVLELRLSGAATRRGEPIGRGVERAGEPQAARRDRSSGSSGRARHPDGAVPTARRSGRWGTSIGVSSLDSGSIRHSRPSRGTVAHTAPSPAATRQTPASNRRADGRSISRDLGAPTACSRATCGVAQSPTQTASPATTRGAGLTRPGSDCLHG